MNNPKDTKFCKNPECDKEIQQPANMNAWTWIRREYCSTECRMKMQRGRHRSTFIERYGL
jgi:hypothetical protein